MNQALAEKLKNLPTEPGVYLMKNSKGEIIYVGKAKILRNRVRSYFNSVSSKDLKTKVLVKQVDDFEIMLTNNEAEALLLERTLIKHHHPTYNVLLKDGKEYPFIRVNFKEDWPRIEKVRRRKDDGAFYIGPFSNAGHLAISLKLMGKVFPLIRCSRHEFRAAKRPCNYYHMKMCMGSCTLPVDQESYRSMIKDALAFLNGNNKDVAKSLKKKMADASEAEEYESAAAYRDQLHALSEVSTRQSAVVKTVQNADCLVVTLADDHAFFHVLIVREGKVIGNENFITKSLIQNEAEALSAFMLQYYDNQLVPPELILPFEIEGAESLLSVLGPSDIVGKPSYKISVSVPKRGPRCDLIETAYKNAEYHLSEWQRKKQQNRVEIDILQKFLKLDKPPKRIECVDISNIQGQAVVASNVCFIDGKPAKDNYRHYKIKDLLPGQQDDFASINEVVRRRIRRGQEEGDLPDLLVIDGGKGQLSAALKARGELESSLNIISIAKSRVKPGQQNSAPQRSYERIFIPGEEQSIPLRPGSPVNRLLTHLRDEAHRFAITHHRKLRAKGFAASELEDIPGVGPTLRKRLLQNFSGLDGIKKASLDELRAVKGVSENLAVAIHSRFH